MEQGRAGMHGGATEAVEASKSSVKAEQSPLKDEGRADGKIESKDGNGVIVEEAEAKDPPPSPSPSPSPSPLEGLNAEDLDTSWVMLSDGRRVYLPRLPSHDEHAAAAEAGDDPRGLHHIKKGRLAWGSTAGAGSDFFQVYKDQRSRELARQEQMDRDWQRKTKEYLFQKAREEKIVETVLKTAKKREKRQRRKGVLRARRQRGEPAVKGDVVGVAETGTNGGSDEESQTKKEGILEPDNTHDGTISTAVDAETLKEGASHKIENDEEAEGKEAEGKEAEGEEAEEEDEEQDQPQRIGNICIIDE